MGKLKKFALIGLSCLAILGVARAMVVKYNAYLVNEAGLAYNNTYPLPLNSYGVDYLSFTSIASSVTFSNQTFTDGQASTGTITVASASGISAAAATDSFTLVNSTIPCGLSLVVNGVSLTSCLQWFPDPTLTVTQVSIAKSISANVPNVTVSTASAGAINLTSKILGSGGNSMSLVSNTSSVTVTSANFTGGKDQASLSLNGYKIVFSTIGTTTQIAASIVAGITGNTSLNTIVVATNVANVVFTTSTAVGLITNYAMTSSTQTSLTIGGPVTLTNGASVGQMWGGKDASYTLVNGSATVINIPSHGFTLGVPVLYTTTSGQAITGLTSLTTYYVIPVTPNSIALASTSTGAVAGIPLVLTSAQAKTTSDTFTLAPLPISGTPSYKWQVSNDDINWADYTVNDQGISVPSVTLSAYTSTGTLNSWDFGEIEYAFIRLNVTAPTQGAIKIQVVGNGKNSSN